MTSVVQFRLCPRCQIRSTKDACGFCNRCRPRAPSRDDAMRQSRCRCGAPTNARDLVCPRCRNAHKKTYLPHSAYQQTTARTLEDTIYDARANCEHALLIRYVDTTAGGPCASCRVCGQELVYQEGAWKERAAAVIPALSKRRTYYLGKKQP